RRPSESAVALRLPAQSISPLHALTNPRAAVPVENALLHFGRRGQAQRDTAFRTPVGQSHLVGHPKAPSRSACRRSPYRLFVLSPIPRAAILVENALLHFLLKRMLLHRLLIDGNAEA